MAIALAGCGIGSAVTAPVRYVFHEPEPASAANSSDVTTPGRPVAAPSPTPVKRTATRKTTGSQAQPSPRVTANKSAKLSAGAVQFPVAKPVPGKQGLVFNPFNSNGAYIDVSGYAPGSKVKDPDSQKIFVVP
ncbi:MAG: hypothetical protein DME57_07645 [Verrucomicrobia bacterium]|nr:MAG: hypothetical protein DME57_07645 [Verrucomicrobiota bacterium]